MEYRLEFAGKQVGTKTYKSWSEAQRTVTRLFIEAERRLLHGEIKNCRQTVSKMNSTLRRLSFGLVIVPIQQNEGRSL